MRAAQLLAPTLLVGALLALAACKGVDPKTDRYVIGPASAEFYKYGPAQAFGADLALPRGAPVTMVRRDFGFSQVRLADGTTGYMATDDLKPAPPPPSTPRPRASQSRGVARKRTNVQPMTGNPLFDVSDVPLNLPLPQNPEPKPSQPKQP